LNPTTENDFHDLFAAESGELRRPIAAAAVRPNPASQPTEPVRRTPAAEPARPAKSTGAVMNRFPRWRPRLALLIGIWGAAAAGLTVPSKYSDPLRTAVTDGLRPGRVASVTVAAQFQVTVARFRAPPTGDELNQLRAELAVLRTQSQTERAAHIALVQQTSAETDAGPVAPDAAYDPLLIAGLVPAKVLGREPDVLKERFARILSRGTSSAVAVDDLVLADDSPHLDRGADAGLEAGQPVLSGRVVVGRIGQAGRWTSTLNLVTDPAYKASAQLVRDSRSGLVLGAAGVLAGNGDGTCRLDRVPAEAPVSVGDFVYSVEQNTEQPAPLYYGRVVTADLPAGADFWSIDVEPAFDTAALDTVQILQVSLNPDRMADASAPAPFAADAAAATPAPVPPQP
jgi:hypothetical protein